MKFRLMSDLHLEFEDRVLDFTPMPCEDDAETVLILAGDIATGTTAIPFLESMCNQFYKVVYVFGNHEYYHQEVNSLLADFRKYMEEDAPANLIFLDNKAVVIDGVRLVGGTLWTDFDGQNWFAMNTARNGMNDFHCITIKEGNETSGYRERRWLPEDSVRAHKETLFTITETVREPFDGPTVVVTHHLPHPLSVDPQFRNHVLNPAYVTNLDMYIEEYDIAVWCHGHTHSNVDEDVHGTRILCNPRGYYPRDLNRDFNEEFVFEV